MTLPSTMTYTKRFVDTPVADIANEVRLQAIGAEYGLSPNIIETDYTSFITMEDLGEMSIADYYGEAIDDIPETLKQEIWNILWTLYSCANIEYIDVTPYNFIEKNGKVWIIDYGHATLSRRGHIHPWLLSVLSDTRMTITDWNPEFV